MEFTNLLLWVQENRQSEKFYIKLGFEVVKSDDQHSTIKLGKFEIILVNMRDEQEFSRDSMAGEKGLGVYLYIRADNIDTKYQELIDAGFSPHTKPRDWPWGNREFILKDPDGYKLCFWQPLVGS